MKSVTPLALSLSILLGGLLWADAPPGYYDGTAGLTGDSLRAKLTQIISTGYVDQSYDAARADMYEFVDDPNLDNTVTCVYTGISANVSDIPSATANNFTAEHSWPQGWFDQGGANGLRPMVSDLHHLFPVIGNENSCRNNHPFNTRTADFDECFQIGDGGGKGTRDGITVYEVRPAQRGNTARAMLYMIVRYWDSDVIFDPDQGPQDVTPAQISLYTQWALEDPVDSVEMTRNDRVYSLQNNRNPFVDHPEFIASIWGGSTPTTTMTPTPTPTPGPVNYVWINEVHYDNLSGDVDEGVELAGVAGTNLASWQLVAYNGTDGTTYTAFPALTGVIPNQQNGFGTIWFPAVLQNGSPDGVALIAPGNIIVQFLSYEGTVLATGGPAIGQSSINMGVTEDGNTAAGSSLQLTGNGSQYSDFTWAAEAAHTRGLPNNGQTFLATPTPTPTPTTTPSPTSTPSLTPSPTPIPTTATPTSTPSPTPTPTATPVPTDSVWINEIHYENTGADVDEGVELAGVAGTDLATWQLIAYNGTGGVTYSAFAALGGTLPNQQNGYGTLWFPAVLQNGAPDGVALVAPGNTVAQFLSYEGTFTATNGAANGFLSNDIGVSEGEIATTLSLQLTGNGTRYDDFTWAAPGTQTRGLPNNSQTFGTVIDPADLWMVY